MSRPEYTYDLPEALAKSIGITSITLVELTSDEEMMAARRAAGDQVRLAWELPKESLRGVSGKRVGAADGSIDAAWNGLHPKARSLVMQAYNDLHNPAQEDVKTFLASRQVTVS